MSSAVAIKPLDPSREANYKWLHERSLQARRLAEPFPDRHPVGELLEEYALCCLINMVILDGLQEMEDSGQGEKAAEAEGDWIAEHMTIGMLLAQGRWKEASEAIHRLKGGMNRLSGQMPTPRKWQ